MKRDKKHDFHEKGHNFGNELPVASLVVPSCQILRHTVELAFRNFRSTPDLLKFAAATLYNSEASEATVTTVFVESVRKVRGDSASSPWSLQVVIY